MLIVDIFVAYSIRKRMDMRIFLILISVLSLLGAAQDSGRDPYEALNFLRLKNGMEVYMLPDPKAQNVRLQIVVGVGYDNETERDYGLSHLVEHIVFRDRRVPHHDYLDYIKEEGGKGVNGYTTRYETGYRATIEPEKGEWLVGTFASMLFDKNVTQEDLEIEKSALQIEIGEPRWYHAPLYAVKNFFKTIMPPREDIFNLDFSLPKERPLPDLYFAQRNNKGFSLAEVMERYERYYYPANMKLFIAGDFDTASMRKKIEETYGKIDKSGSERIVRPHHTPRLNGKPFERFYLGTPRSYAYIGTKYILDDYRKYLIIDSYILSLADRLQRRLRNLYGKSYSVNPQNFGREAAQIAAVGFDGLADSIDGNLAAARELISEDVRGMDEESIGKALEAYDTLYFASQEHDVDTLMDLIDTARYVREEYNITDRSPYDIFRSITPELFARTVSDNFRPQNGYSVLFREYYLFPMDSFVFAVVMILIFIVLYRRYYASLLKRKGLYFTQRDIIFQRRCSSRFIGFLVFAITIIAAIVLQEWVSYLLFWWIQGDPYYPKRLDAPWSFIVKSAEFLIYTAIFLALISLWRYYAKIVVTKNALIAIGSRILPIKRDEIESVKAVPFKESRFTNRVGTFLRFYKPLVEVLLKDGRRYYIRSANARHLSEDLTGWLSNDGGRVR